MQKQNIDLAILREIWKLNQPVGATYLAKVLNIPSATIGRKLVPLEDRGLLIKITNRGRKLTDRGIAFLEENQVRTSKMNAASRLIVVPKVIPKKRMLEVLEVRRILETKTAELACLNATEKEIEELDKILHKFLYEAKFKGGGHDQDLRLHLQIAKMSRNATLYRILKLILVEGDAHKNFTLTIRHLLSSQLEMHRQIVEAIKNRDAHAAIQATQRNIDQVICELKRAQKELTIENRVAL
jgi:predicted transcriptional regulator